MLYPAQQHTCTEEPHANYDIHNYYEHQYGGEKEHWTWGHAIWSTDHLVFNGTEISDVYNNIMPSISPRSGVWGG